MKTQISISKDGVTRLPKEVLEILESRGQPLKLTLSIEKASGTIIMKKYQPLGEVLRGIISKNTHKAYTLEEIDDLMERAIAEEAMDGI